MIRRLSSLFLMLVVMCCPAPLFAQQNNSPSEKTKTDDAAVRAKAIAVLESLASELGSLQSAENRARIGSNIASSLWEHNERRARDLFALVQQDLSNGLRIPETPTAEDSHTLKVFMNLRADTIARIAKRDPELAYSFFKATQFPRDQEIPISIRLSEEALETRLAKQLASSNPDLSLELALKLLEPKINNVSSDAVRIVLRQLNRKHKEQALVLYKAIVRKLKEAELVYDWESRNFAVSLVNSVTPPAIEEATFRELVEVFIKTAVANGCTKPAASEEDQERDEVCRAVGAALPQIAKVSPARANQLKRWRLEREYGAPIDPFYQELEDLMAEGTVEELLELSAQNPQAAPQLRWQAMYKARAKGDYERARKILKELNLDEQSREYWLKRFDREEARVELDERKFEEAQKEIAEVPNVSRRIFRSLTLASQIGASNRANALKLLGQTAETLETMKPGVEQTQFQIFVAAMFCTEKSDRGLVMMEAMVPKLNELVEASAKLDGYGMRYLREGEWNMSAESAVGNLLTQLARHADYFAWCDFDRALNAAGQFQRNEIRMMAQLRLAQGILAGQPKRLIFDSEGQY